MHGTLTLDVVDEYQHLSATAWDASLALVNFEFVESELRWID